MIMKKHRMRYGAVFAFAAISGFMLLQTSQDVQRAEEEMTAIRLNVENEQESIRVLQAEWDYLNNPARLEALAAQYLDINAPEGKKIEDAKILATPASLPAPFIPVLPSQKPESIISPVSYTAPVISAPPAQPVSTQKEFDTLLTHLQSEGTR